MLYKNLLFPKVKGRPFFYTNFVATVDGKTQVLKNTADYWPIGSKKDYEVLLELRVFADCLIHGANLAREFGEMTIANIGKRSFKQQRELLGKNAALPYYVITNTPASFKERQGMELMHLKGGNLKELVVDLKEKGYKNILVEGGPTLLGSFLKEDLMDEIFLTIAPKIFGSEKNSTLTLVEGYLFPKENIKHLKLLSIKQIKSEIYLRYEIKK